MNLASRMQGIAPYRRSPSDADLLLDANEGRPPVGDIPFEIESCRRYPDVSGLEASLAGRLGVGPDQVVVSNGGDDIIDRVCRAWLEPGRVMATHAPSFEMISRSARLAGAEVRTVRWMDGPLDEASLLDIAPESTGVIAVVSPNNPTGSTVPVQTLRRIATERSRSILMLDGAYVEFADEDLTIAMLDLPNVIVVRTLSKAWGLAGLRIGYAVTSSALAESIRAAGGPFPVAGPCLDLAKRLLEEGDCQPFVARVREEREVLVSLLRDLGASPMASQGNFVTARVPEAHAVHEALSGRGIAVRRFTDPLLEDHFRVTLPGERAAFDRLVQTLREVMT